MEHFYESIYGFCDYLGLYKKMVKIFSSGSHFVEIGSFLGKSSVYMAVEIINSGKDIKFDCISSRQAQCISNRAFCRTILEFNVRILL